MPVKEVTTQDAGVPITKEQLQKLQLLEQIVGLDKNELLNVHDYPADRWEAYQAFCEVFRFYDMIEVAEYEYIYKLLRTVPHLCSDPKKLLDPERYDVNDWEEARWAFEQRYVLFDCFKGVHIVLGEAGAGKSCWCDFFAHHGRDWYDQGVVSYKAKLPEKFGEYDFISDEEFLDELIKVTEIVNRKGDLALRWIGDKEQTLSRLHGKTIILEEAHKIVGAEHRTLLSLLWKDVIGEFRHYDCVILLLTHKKNLVDPYRVHPYFTHQVNISLSHTDFDTSDVRIYNMETMAQKPVQNLNRKTVADLGWWVHNAPIAMRSNISAKQIRAKQEEREAKIAQEVS